MGTLLDDYNPKHYYLFDGNAPLILEGKNYFSPSCLSVPGTVRHQAETQRAEPANLGHQGHPDACRFFNKTEEKILKGRLHARLKQRVCVFQV